MRGTAKIQHCAPDNVPTYEAARSLGPAIGALNSPSRRLKLRGTCKPRSLPAPDSAPCPAESPWASAFNGPAPSSSVIRRSTPDSSRIALSAASASSPFHQLSNRQDAQATTTTASTRNSAQDAEGQMMRPDLDRPKLLPGPHPNGPPGLGSPSRPPTLPHLTGLQTDKAIPLPEARSPGSRGSYEPPASHRA